MNTTAINLYLDGAMEHSDSNWVTSYIKSAKVAVADGQGHTAQAFINAALADTKELFVVTYLVNASKQIG